MGSTAAGRPRTRLRSTLQVGTILLLLLALYLSGFSAAALSGGPAPADSGVGTQVEAHPAPVTPTVTVTVQNRTQENLSSFWGVGLAPTSTLANATNETTGTPLSWDLWPAGKNGDAFNMTSGQFWANGFATQEADNESQFVQWCVATACHAILQVPGEIDSPSTAAWEVGYTEQVLGFHAAYWEIGDEPYGWTHYGISWNHWSATDNFTVSPTGYAQEVQVYVAAMRAVDPAIRIIGLPGVGAGTKPDGPWLNATVALNGPNLSAIAIHDYPGERGPARGNLTGFFQTLLNPKTNMVKRITNDQAEVRAACPTCGPIQFLVDEFGSGTGVLGTWQPFMQTYPEVPFVTAELLLMMASNVSNADVFSLRSSYNGSLFNGPGLAMPLDSLYTEILPHFGSVTLTTNVSGSVNGVFAGAATSPAPSTVTLLAVNTNTTHAVLLHLQGAAFPSYGSYSVWRANNSTTSTYGAYSNSSGVGPTGSWLLPPSG